MFTFDFIPTDYTDNVVYGDLGTLDANVHPEIEGESVYIHAADTTALECAIENRLEEMEK